MTMVSKKMIYNHEDDDCGGGFHLTPPSLSLFSLAEAFALSVSAVLTRIELNWIYLSFHFYSQSLPFWQILCGIFFHFHVYCLSLPFWEEVHHFECWGWWSGQCWGGECQWLYDSILNTSLRCSYVIVSFWACTNHKKFHPPTWLPVPTLQLPLRGFARWQCWAPTSTQLLCGSGNKLGFVKCGNDFNFILY